MESNEKKEINILGKNNRYQMSKLTIQKKEPLKKKNIHFSEDMFCIKNQYELLNKIICNYDPLLVSNEIKKIKMEIDKKMASYKSQDLKKNRYSESQFINLEIVLNKLKESNMECFYCQEKIFLLYDIVRELKQWTLDRIDNELGHNKDNVVISCLDCNLKRRRKGQDAFLFTKQLSIVKKDS